MYGASATISYQNQKFKQIGIINTVFIFIMVPGTWYFDPASKSSSVRSTGGTTPW